MALKPAAAYGLQLAAAAGSPPTDAAALANWTAIAAVLITMLQKDVEVDPGAVPVVGLTYLNATATPTSVTGTGTLK